MSKSGYTFAVLVTVIGWLQFAVAGGFLIGNGGDLVLCHRAPSSTYHGYYSLDYLVEGRHGGRSEDLAENSLLEITNRVLATLLKIDPYLAHSYKDFIDSFESGHARQRVWEPMEANWAELEDENMLKLVPENCRSQVQGQNGRPMLRQAVIRWSNDPFHPRIRYEFDSTLIKELKFTRPMQLSYLLLHEWLWDTTDNVQLIRKVNKMIHHGLIRDLGPERFVSFFASYGGYNKAIPLCSRSERIVVEVLGGDRASCPHEDVLETIYDLDLSGLEEPLWIGDLGGLTATKELSFDGTMDLLKKVPRHSLDSLIKLETLSFRDCALDHFPWELWSYDVPPTLQKVDLRGNRLSENYREELERKFKKKYPNVELVLSGP